MSNTERPNILWICADQQRHDTISSLGHGHVDTPNLDGLVSRGTAFTSAYSQSPICTPSRVSMLTGKYPAAHRVHRNGNDRFPDDEVLVTRILADAGYTCGLVGKLHLSRADGRVENRADDGYSEFHWSHHPRPDWPDANEYTRWLRDECGEDPTRLFDPLAGIRHGPGLPEELQHSSWCARVAMDYIRDHVGSQPWLLSLNFFDPHPAFLPPAEYLAKYQDRDLPPALPGPGGSEHDELQMRVDHQAAGEPLPSPGEVHAMRAAYYATIEFLDSRIGLVLDELERSGQRENTIVIFTSDHGDMLGDHGFVLKGARLYDVLVRVPLVISWPDRFDPGAVNGSLVELIDLAPTLLEFAGIAIPEYMQGTSIVPILEGSRDSLKSCVVSEYYDALDLPNGSHVTAVRNGNLRTVVYHDAGAVEAYRLDRDPGEVNDIWPLLCGTQEGSDALLSHLTAYASTTSPGIGRTGQY